MGFDWKPQTTFNEDAFSTTHPCHKCFFRFKHPHHYDGAEWNRTTTIIWECGIRHQSMRIILYVKCDHRTRKVFILNDNYQKLFDKAPCEEKKVLSMVPKYPDICFGPVATDLDRVSVEFEQWMIKQRGNQP